MLDIKKNNDNTKYDESKLSSIPNLVFHISIGNDNPKDLYSTLYV